MTDPTPTPVRLAGDIARQLDQLAGQLTQAPPALAAQIIATVLDPEEGVLGRFTTLVATGSHFAKDHAENGLLPPEVWLALGRAANELHDIGLDLDEHTDTLRQLTRPVSPGTAPPVAKPVSPLIARRHR
jgi:predicted transcriptional regulator